MKNCIECGASFTRNPRYGEAQWARARFCGNPCSARHRGRKLVGRPFPSTKRAEIRPIAERFWEKVDTSGECWLWTASRWGSGYGQFSLGRGDMVAAHRYSLILSGVEIPDGYEVDHLCRNKACVRPSHLEPVTGAENRRRASPFIRRPNRERTTCFRGHPYTETNTYWIGTERRCRTCSRDNARARRAA